MDCSAPPPLTEDQLSDALDGAAGPDVHAHLARCSACAARLKAARRVEDRLHASLRRWDCPAPQRLADYHLGRAPAEEDRAIGRHLAGCVRCRAEIEELRLFLRDKEPQPRRAPAAAMPARQRPRGPLIARPLPRAAAPALRGGTGPLIVEAGGVTIFLSLQPSGDGQVDVQGQLVADDQDRWTGALVELRQGGALQATAEVDDLGTFGCGPVAAGVATLRLTSAYGPMIVLPDLDLSA